MAIDKTALLAESSRKGRFGSMASLRNANVPLSQHNVKAKKTTKKSSAKKTSKKSSKKAAAKKS